VPAGGSSSSTLLPLQASRGPLASGGEQAGCEQNQAGEPEGSALPRDRRPGAHELKKRLRAHREQEGTDGAFAERLLEGVATIEREFDGEQRDRLLALVDETFERHLQIRQNTARAQIALEQLRANQERLFGLLKLILTPPGSGTLH
jgi:hypothetical protein